MRSLVFVALALAFNAGLYATCCIACRCAPNSRDSTTRSSPTTPRWSSSPATWSSTRWRSTTCSCSSPCSLLRGADAVPAEGAVLHGILGAIAFRALRSSLGAVLMRYHWDRGVRRVPGRHWPEDTVPAEKPLDPENNPAIRLVRRLLPVTPGSTATAWTRIDGKAVGHAVVRRAGLHRVQRRDCFAIDSVPAIFALTNGAADRVHLERVRDHRPTALAVFDNCRAWCRPSPS